MHLPPELRRTALEHDGVLTAADARAAGLDRAAVQRRLAAGVWRRRGRGLYTVADHPVTQRTKVRLAVLAVGPRAVLSGTAAAWWQGLADAPSSTITVTAPPGRHASPVDGVRVRYRDLDDAEVIVRSGLPVTCLPLAVLEAALEDSITIVDNALLRRRVSLKQLTTAVDRRTGTTDAHALTRIIEALGTGARSAAERVAVALLEDADIDGWSANHPAAGYFIDVAFPARQLAVEIDGFAHHRDATTFQNDRKRRNDLIASGWTVLNFTWADLTERGDDVVARIRQALSDAA
ncbi:DUF559 domain-containing protein [Gordonia sp. zg691]|uniref:DUF559 domain-containing protein n=1 Tax=Gordonia jinghuaiqii TaxID=2758710 RepID=A0A7D7QRU7_9ACTN|nr:DUF559 domain-containing protein [Gordonia jinghuaiqii]MBD0862149.1 DUF559 domain-containing protein [Gordonia jinghuaiqii]MCR5978627.1 DUF559 domain-containing protein [Gordonia jinghuaiqii]QMT02946.1 DUF559 domain-containing protein [Gordonia jinghuaiqii]